VAGRVARFRKDVRFFLGVEAELAEGGNQVLKKLRLLVLGPAIITLHARRPEGPQPQEFTDTDGLGTNDRDRHA